MITCTFLHFIGGGGCVKTQNTPLVTAFVHRCVMSVGDDCIDSCLNYTIYNESWLCLTGVLYGLATGTHIICIHRHNLYASVEVGDKEFI